MSGNKNIERICLIITACAVIITLLFINGRSLGLEPIVDEDAESYEGTEYFTANDQNGTWSTDDATVITLEGDDAKISGKGVYVLDGSVYITGGGKYVISGKLDDGSIVVDAYESSKVYIMLDGADVNCSDNAAILVKKADKVFVTLKDGTSNQISCGSEYSKEAEDDNVTGALFSHDDLTINGSGSLKITSGYKHGIDSNDDLVIAGGTIEVTATGDAIRANDSVRIMNASITADAGDDGVYINSEEGYFYMESGSLSIVSGGDGIHSLGDVTVAGGELTVDAADDGIHSDTAFLISAGTVDVTECYEGIEALTIDIEGGDTTIYCKDDGLNANGGSGDMFSDPKAGFGGKTDGGMPEGISGNGMPGRPDGGNGMEFGQGRGEMPEGISGNGMPGRPEGGNGMEFSQDRGEMPEGISGNGMPGRPEDGNGMQADDEDGSGDDALKDSEDVETYIRISGGKLTIINDSGRDADGIDSNGDVIIDGGEIYVSMVNSGSNCAIDFASEMGGKAVVNGGYVVACGGSSMVEKLDEGSKQASFLYIDNEGVDAGTRVELLDEDGNVLISYEVPQSFSALTISCPEMTVGETYTLKIGDSEETITLEEISSSFGDETRGGFGMMR